MSTPNLSTRIRRSKCATADGKGFVPNNAIQVFTTQQEVQKNLLDMAKKRVFPRNTAMQPLVDYVMDQHRPAKKIYLILALCESLKYLSILRDARFCDKSLPIEAKWSEDEERYIVTTKGPGGRVTHAAFNDWHENDIDSFEDKQWLFMAPVFVSGRFDYAVNVKCPLPILPNDEETEQVNVGYSGAVYEVKVHKAHLKFDVPVERVASKKLHFEKRDYFKKEAESLRLLHELKHPHLIRPLAAYQRGYSLGFLFPWAEGGTLRGFWERHERTHTRDVALVRWVVSQLRGLSGATAALHNKNCRHTDIKPLNILRFDDRKGTSPGILRIADVGLAKIHKNDTEQRKLMNELATKARTGTERYIPPEFGNEDQLSRVFDVWSLGCVFLEFLIWTVYGWERLQEFIKKTDRFWQDDRGRTSKLHPKVDEYITDLKTLLKEENSSDALRMCLSLVTDGMLVLAWDQREKIAITHAKLRGICKGGEKKPGFLLKMPIPLSQGIPQTVGMSSSNARELEIPELSILKDRSVGHPFGQWLWKYGLIGGTGQQEIRKLEDQWQSLTDNTFARRLFGNTRKQIFYTERSYHEICRKCTGIWNVNFAVFDRMRDILRRSQDCPVCGLLYRFGKERGLCDSDYLRCRRSGSTVRVDPDGPTILSLFADPESSAPPETQLGYAQLPEPGGDFQLALLKEWLRVCDEEHNHHFISNTKLPTRILDVGTINQPLLCLRDGLSLGAAPYVALSHCWGAGSRFVTLTSNLEEHKTHIELELLPKTFKDAVRVTRALRFRFLWIDSLCIVQDDLEDWETEAASMEQVFSFATFTIAASSASSSEEGFLSSTRDQSPFVTVRTPSHGTGFICKSIDNFHQDVERSVLNKRGWVFQERVLARRTFHFTSSQIYWECGSGIHCESLMKMTNPTSSFLGDSDFPNSALGYFKGARILLFQNVYQMYSALSFTHVSDRCIAIKGLEARLLRVFDTKGGFGVIDRYLHRSLLWQREQGSALVPITYPDGKHVPSWSWMAYSGRISYLDAPFDGVDWVRDVLSPFTSKTGHRQHWEVDLTTKPHLLHVTGRSFEMDPTELSERITFDKDDDAMSVEDLRCVVFGIERLAGVLRDSERFVLIVKPVSPRDGKLYMRCGVGKMLTKHILQDVGAEIVVQ